MAVLVTMLFALFGLVKPKVTTTSVYYYDNSVGDSFTDVKVDKTGKMLVNLWGGGGAGGAYKSGGYAGGGGVFVSCYLDVEVGDTVKFRIGQGGLASGYGQDSSTLGDKSVGMSLIFHFIN
jgi:hypothetical protein